MKRGSYGSWLLGFTVAVTRLAAGDEALAHGGVDEDRGPPEPSQAGARSSAADDRRESTEGAEHEREVRLAVRLDLVLGWGKVPFAVQNLPATGVQAITYSRADATPSDVQSFVLGGQFEATEHIGAGVRIPFTLGTFSPVGSAARSTTSFGNVEIEGEISTSLGADLKLVGALGVALPTGQGEEIPATLADVAAASVNAPAYDRFSLARAAALARGYEANALFEPGRLGLIPQVSVVYEGERLRFEPYLKVENLIRTESSLEAPYVGEIVAAVRGGYLIHRHVEAAVRGWVNVGFAGTPEDRRTTVAVEPDLTVSFGPVRAYGGCVLPLAGAPEEAGFLGVRLGLVAAF
jgi:hypothetical protein